MLFSLKGKQTLMNTLSFYQLCSNTAFYFFLWIHWKGVRFPPPTQKKLKGLNNLKIIYNSNGIKWAAGNESKVQYIQTA